MCMMCAWGQDDAANKGECVAMVKKLERAETTW